MLALLPCVISCHTGPKPTARHVVLVTIDTLRADRLGCYGNPSVATPHLDRLAEVLQSVGFRTGAFVSSIRRILDGRPSWDNFSGDTRPQTLARSKPDSL